MTKPPLTRQLLACAKITRTNFKKSALSAIKNFAEKRASQNAFIRVVKHVFYLKRIQEFRDDLERILGLFGVSSAVNRDMALFK